MQFDKSQTYQNLARAFAGECMAGMRYQLMAKTAMQEEYYRLSDCIKSIAKNETVHASTFYNFMLQEGKNAKNVEVDAGYPFRGGSLVEMLRFSAEDEKNEAERIYPEFARIAEEEGYEKISKAFTFIAQIEDNHRVIFEYLAEAVQNGMLYRHEEPRLWICSECGYMHTAKEANKTCPVCQKPQGYVELHLPFDYMGKNGMSRFAEKGEV